MTGAKSGGGGVAVRTVAPKLGQHNEEVFGSVGVSAGDLAALKDKGVI
jgi:crotonobetainyl-CoA:carnitine CoA-transferase CaiB-like acyl-CoA transferase